MIVDNYVVIFADGTRYRFVSKSASDLVLSPMFLKFFLICLVTFALLQQRADLAPLGPWEYIAIYLAVGFVAVLWLFFSIGVGILLHSKQIISFVYTPLLSVPIMAFCEPAAQLMLVHVFEARSEVGVVPLKVLLQPMIVIFLMDMMFGNFVAPLHPSFEPYETLDADQTRDVTMQPVPSKVRFAPSMKVKAAKERSAPAPSAKEPQQDLRFGKTINFKGEEIRVDDILTMQIEDHYLRIETSERKILVRYKISAAVKKIDPEVGLQVNRSAWIARNAIKAVYRTPTYGAEIVLKNGDEFAVSRSRMSGVLETCKRWEIAIESR